MRIEISGIGGEHFEPLPREIHALFVPTQEVPELVEAYEQQLEAMYAAGGWQFVGLHACQPGVTVGEIIEGFEPRQVSKLGIQVILGPIPVGMQQVADENFGPLAGVALYAQI